MDADSPRSLSSYLRAHSPSHARSPSWGSFTEDGLTSLNSAIELDSISYASVQTYNTACPLEPHTPLGWDGQPERARPHVSHTLLETILLVSGIASIAQFAVAIALFIRPPHFNIARQEDPALTLLPTIANVTNKAANFWLSAAVALIGLWEWERHLARRGTSLDEMKGWGALLAKDLAGTALGVRRVGWVPAAVLVFMMGLILAATSAVTNAVTPAPGQVTITRQIIPSPFASDLLGKNFECGLDGGLWCPQALARGFVFDALRLVGANSVSVKMEGYVLSLDGLGIVNPAILEVYVRSSDDRGPRYSSSRSFVTTRMCMEGVIARVDCIFLNSKARSTTLLDPSSNSGIGASLLTYNNSCGRQVTSIPLVSTVNGVMDVSACVDAENRAFLDWAFAGSYAGKVAENEDLIRVQCPVDLRQAAQEFNLSRAEGEMAINPISSSVSCPLTLSPQDVVVNLTSQVNAVLTSLTDPDGGLFAISNRSDHDDSRAIDYLNQVGSVLFRSVYTTTLFQSFASAGSSASGVLSYTGSGTGYQANTTETYWVVRLGNGSKAWLIPLLLATLAVTLSFLTILRPLIIFDPSDVSAVATVALNSSIALGQGSRAGLASDEDGRRRLYFGEAAGDPGRFTLGTEPRAGTRPEKVGRDDDGAEEVGLGGAVGLAR